MQFTQPSTLELVLNGASFLIIIFIGLSIFLKNPKSWTSRFFLILAIILDIYTLVNIPSLHPFRPTAENQLFLIRLVTGLMPIMILAVFLLSHTFPKKEIRLKKVNLIVLSALGFFAGGISLSPYVYKSVSYPNGSPVPEPGIMMAYVLGYCIVVLILSFAILIKRYRNQTGVDKLGSKYFLIGMISTFSFIAIFVFLFVVVFKTSGAVFLGPVFPIILMGSIAYSIAKYSFLDIRPIIARAVSYTLLIGLIATSYFALLLFGFSKFLGLNLSLKNFLINGSLGVLIALIFRPLRLFLTRITDKIFFKGKYNPEKILSELSHTISKTINFNELAQELLTTITKEFRVSNAAILLVSGSDIVNARSIGYKDSALLDDPQLFKFLEEIEKEDRHLFVLSDLEGEQKDFFRKHGMEAVFPIKAEGKHVAILILGVKSSGLPYSNTDLSLLDVFSSESGIAIQNSKLYTDLRMALDSKSRFISVVSHQLRTPVSGIRWGLEELKLGGGQEHQKELLDVSHQKVVFLNEQLDDILTSLDIYDKKISLNKTSCDILNICTDITNDFESQIKTNNLKIIYSIGDNAKLIDADFNKLKKILEVVIKNAVLYSNTNGEIIIETKNITSSDKNFISISITDSGIGITTKEKARLFEEFYRGERAKLKIPDGLGLGMFIAKTFIEAQGGKINVNSAGADSGTKVEIILPLAI